MDTIIIYAIFCVKWSTFSYISKRIIKFKHAAPRNFAYKGKTIPLVVQALKELGKVNIDEQTLSALSAYMEKAPDKDSFEKDLHLAPAWIQHIVKPLIKLIYVTD